ncbi:hypothetical protein ACFLYB_00595 [Chloroflexota bacterium]
MAQVELNVIGWIVFVVFTAVILFMFIAEMIRPINKRKSKDKA